MAKRRSRKSGRPTHYMDMTKRKKKAVKRHPVRDLITKSRKLWDKYVARPTKTNLRAFIKHVDVMEAQHKVYPSKMLAKEMAKFRTALGAEMVEHGLTATPNPSDIPPSRVLEAELKDIRRKKKRDRTRKLEQALIESRLPESSPGRRRNPEESHWAIRIPAGVGVRGTPGRYAQIEGIEYEVLGPRSIRILSYGRFEQGNAPETDQRYRIKEDELGIVEGVTLWEKGQRAPRGKKAIRTVVNEKYLTDYPKAEGSSMILPGQGYVANPEGWQRVPDTRRNSNVERYQGHGVTAAIGLVAGQFMAQIQDPKTGRWHWIEEDIEEARPFSNRDAAFDELERVAKLFREAKIDQEPRYTEEWLRWFAAQKPNQVDYVRLFWDNDGNGAYDINLTSSVKESRELFEEIFEEYL